VIPDVIFDSNLISHTSVGQDIARIETAHQVFTDYTLSELQATYPATFLNNIEGDPLFNDSANYNFTLQDTSPAIDTGTWLTTVVSASGTSTQVQLDDSSYFFDGWGIAGETGDLIKTATGVTATITNVNSGTSEITVSPAISWVQNEGVALDYAGNAPDMGYVESGVTTAPTVSAAVGLAAGGSPTESGTTGIFTFSVDSGGSVSVEWVLAGTGTWGTDVEMAGVSMIISPSISGVTYLTPIDDTDAESTESFGMNLVLPAGANYTLLSPSGVTLWMPDDDPATVSISNVGSPSGGPTESGTTGQVTFSVDSGGSVSVEWVLSGSGTWGTDVEMSGTSMIISPSISGVTYLTPIADALIEPAETFGYNLILPSGATYQLATLTGVTFTLPNEVVLWSGTITFDNGPGEISFGPGGVGVMQ